MPPRKKQRVDDTALKVAPATGRVTRSTTKAARAQVGATHAAAEQPDTTTKALVRVPKRVILKGRLRSLPDFALEIQLEIYSYLGSRDLLYLSRTCKKFRAFFLDRPLNERLWTRARENTSNLPERPPFMSEPAFIHLLYSHNCQNCGAANVRKILWSYFLRVCSACYPKVTMWCGDAAREAVEIDPERYLYDGTPSLYQIFAAYGSVKAYFYIESYKSPAGYNDKKRNRIPTAAVQSVFERFKALPKPVTTDARHVFFNGLQEEYEIRLKYARLIHAWQQDQEDERIGVLDNARMCRFEAIVTRLRGSGWAPELDFIGTSGLEEMSRMPLVRVSSKLTEGAWRKVLVVLEPFLNDIRAERLDTELRATLRTRFAALEDAIVTHCVAIPREAHMDHRPQYIDLAFEPEIRAILDVPVSQNVTSQDFADIIPPVVERWKAQTRQSLLDYIRPHLGEIAADVDPLKLATALFAKQESRRTRTIRYSAIIAPVFKFDNSEQSYGDLMDLRTDDHYSKDAVFCKEDDPYVRTTKSLHWSTETVEAFRAQEKESHGYWSTRKPLSLENLADEKTASLIVRRMRDLVSAVGLDPARATIEDLDKCGVWLRCASCETKYPNNAIHAFSWEGAYRHGEDWHSSTWCVLEQSPASTQRVPPEWKRADSADMAKVDAYLQNVRSDYYMIWSCTLCRTFDAKGGTMRAHLKDVHDIVPSGGIQQARQEGLIYPHPALDVWQKTAWSNRTCAVLRNAIRPNAHQ
ncbi:hypothetical protein C8Q77DRAFT_1133312 [Trametes polyzona]|nr:hypothetical protein C8Q77DRAFT_1133312 [Trametes polyzona]